MQYFLFGDLTPDFKMVNPDGFPGSLSFIRFINSMDVPLIVSYDGQYGHEYIKADDSIDINMQLCSSPSCKTSLLRRFTVVYVKSGGGIPKGGTLTITGFYQV